MTELERDISCLEIWLQQQGLMNHVKTVRVMSSTSDAAEAKLAELTKPVEDEEVIIAVSRLEYLAGMNDLANSTRAGDECRGFANIITRLSRENAAMKVERDDSLAPVLDAMTAHRDECLAWISTVYFRVCGRMVPGDYLPPASEVVEKWDTVGKSFVAAETKLAEAAAALTKISESDIPRPVCEAWAKDGSPSKHDKCIHGRFMWEDCEPCSSEYAQSALTAITNGANP